MGLFGNALSGSRAFPTNEPEAVMGILIAVIAADGDISDSEAESFMYLANNTKSLGPMEPNVFRGHVDTCLSLLRREGPAPLMERCAGLISAAKRQPLFINACDLIMRDGRVEQEEERLVENLQTKLDIDGQFAQAAVSLILAKYSL